MFKISHNDAIILENLVRNLFRCDRAGVSGLANADHFESCPMDAAVMVVSYIYARNLERNEVQYDEFLSKYSSVFNYPEENNAEDEVQNYINDLREIVSEY